MRPENSKLEGRYGVMQVESPPFLNYDDNFMNQYPFLEVPDVVGEGFFNNPNDLRDIARFVRFVALADPTLRKDGQRIQSIRSVTSADTSQVIVAWNMTKNFMDKLPYLDQYIQYYWVRRGRREKLFELDGEPLAGTREEVETFPRYQTAKMRAERAATFLGLKEESPGLAGPDMARDIGRGKSWTNRYWRVVVKSELLK